MNDPLADATCSTCHATLARALVREVRHYEETRLVEITCGLCEHSFLAIWVDGANRDAVGEEDVLNAAAMLADARGLTDLMSPSDLAIDEAA
jgi:hypothetical protein